MSAPITEIDEALKLLNTLADQGKLAEDNNYDWCGDCQAWVSISYLGSGYCDVCRGQDLYDEHWFGLLVKGARAMLDEWDRFAEEREKHSKLTSIEGEDECRMEGFFDAKEDDLILLANAYRPAMVKRKWWPNKPKETT